MKSFVQILVGGTVLFLSVSILQEHDTFIGGPPVPGWLTQDPSATADAEDAVRSFITLASHTRNSGGDPGFLERLPASDEVKQELLDEIVYLKRNGRIDAYRLVAAQLLSADRVGEDRAIVSTAERWEVQARKVDDGSALAPPATFLVFTRYTVTLRGTHWMVTAWDFADPPEEADSTPAPPAQGRSAE